MKFLLDAQLPKKLSEFLNWKGFDSKHTLDLPQKNRTTDNQINDISLSERRVVISKDLDFIESLLISNKPYKLIYIAVGNISNKELLEIFSKNIEIIISNIDKSRLVELTKTDIVVKL